MITEIEKPYTWAKLKDFCSSLSDEQLSQTVRVIREDETIEIMDASELGEDRYMFHDPDEEYSVTKDDYEPEMNFDGKYTSLEEALANEEYHIVPKTNVYLFEKF